MEYSHEFIMPNDDIPFKMFVFEGKDGNYVREKHWHRSVEIFALFEGELRFFLNEKEYPLKPGEFMLVNSNEIHSIQSPKANRTIVLQIPLVTFENYYTEERFIYFSHSSRLQDEEVMRLIEDMYETYARRDCGYELKVLGQFYLLVYLLVTKYREMEVSMDLVRQNKKLNKLSAIHWHTWRITIPKTYPWRAWRRSSAIRPPICPGCFRSMPGPIIKPIWIISGWNMHTRIW